VQDPLGAVCIAVRSGGLVARHWQSECTSALIVVLHPVYRMQDPSVMCASLCALGELVARDARPYKNLIPSFVSILKQITDGKLPKAFDYHKVPAPFIQVRSANPSATSSANCARASRIISCVDVPGGPAHACVILAARSLQFHAIVLL